MFAAIAVQRPAVTAYIKAVRRKNPSATPADVMKTIESHYVATTTAASAAAGASAAIPVVGIPAAIGLGVADLLFFYETTALFALCMAELRGIPINDPERAKAVVLGAVLGEKRKSKVTELIMGALPAGTTIAGARAVAGATPKWGEVLAQQLPDSALVPVTIVLARQAVAQGAVIGTVKISTKAIPVIGAVAGGATSFFFGSGVVKSCRAGFPDPAPSWPSWLELTDSDADDDAVPGPSRAHLAMRSASDPATKPRALTAARNASTAVAGAVGGAAKAVGAVGASAAGAAAGIFKRNKRDADGGPVESGPESPPSGTPGPDGAAPASG
ncbi:hypothetical protein [Luedemannella helvata]|uniref:hypothetical protein n=1 Tax=Luedemannella helvata TaxID=349315 RepID=UPI0031D14438